MEMSDQKALKETGLLKLEARGIDRRTFIKYCAATAAALGLDYYFGDILAEAAAAAIQKKPVIWIQGQGCTGCSTSLLSTMRPGPGELLLDMVSMRFNTTVMASAGDVAVGVMEKTVAEGGYLLVVEGSVPTANPRYCMSKGMAFDQLLAKTAKNASAVIAAGTCAAYGGIPAAGLTGAKGVGEIIGNKGLVNIPGCPYKPDWLVGTLLHYLSFNSLPALDSDLRPRNYFGNHFIHDTCPRVAFFEKGQFLEDWNDPATMNWCLLKMGCKGPVTYADCNRVFWNDGVNTCLRSGAPCAACVQPQFYQGVAPLYVSPFVPGREGEPLQLVDRAGQQSIDLKSAALGAGVVAAPLIVGKVLELMKEKKEGVTKVGH
jgi:hydrogenase small subunit